MKPDEVVQVEMPETSAYGFFGMNVSVEESILIAASPTAIWDYTQDWSRRAEWDPSVRSAEMIPGEERTIRARTPGGTFLVQYKQYERPHRTRLAMTESTSRWVTGGGGAWTYLPEKDGTRFTQRNTLVIGNPVLGWMFQGLLRWRLRRATRRALENAKRIIEAQTPRRRSF